VLWTRLAPDVLNGGGMPPETVPVEWQVASDEKMRNVVQRGTAIATPELAHSIHAEVSQLRPGTWYWYQFFVGQGENRVASPVGRTRTAPANVAGIDQFRFAFASCQNYQDGYYTAYQHMTEEDLDLVIHLGDYIYEGPRRLDRVRQHPIEQAQNLEQYRLRYAVYKSDPDLQRAHALFPWAVIPDDHEVSDNYASDIPDLDSPREGFLQRRASAYQAYYEHLPLRRASIPNGSDIRLYRRLQFGSLINFHLLDTRQHRTDQACGDKVKPVCEERNAPDATMMGAAQEQWLFDGLSNSTARWNVVAQQVFMSEFDFDPGANRVYAMDKWDGYPAARARFTGFLGRRRPSNPVLIAGDNHNNWVFDLKHDFRDAKSPVLAPEFVGTSITSGRDGSDQDSEYTPALSANPHVKFLNSRRGYVRCKVTSKLWTTDFRIVPYVEKAGAPIHTWATYVVANGQPGAIRSS
jgi:alkaline phosphatase D